MILPGISGSFVLLMLGLYDHVITALEQRDDSVLGMYAIGLSSAPLCSVVYFTLAAYRDLVVSLLMA